MRRSKIIVTVLLCSAGLFAWVLKQDLSDLSSMNDFEKSFESPQENEGTQKSMVNKLFKKVSGIFTGKKTASSLKKKGKDKKNEKKLAEKKKKKKKKKGKKKKKVTDDNDVNGDDLDPENRKEMARRTIGVYSKMAQYPLTSTPLDPKTKSDPLTKKYDNSNAGQGTVTTADGLTVRKWKDKMHFIASEEKVELFLEVKDRGEKAEAVIDAVVYDPNNNEVGKLAYNFDQVTGAYKAVFAPNIRDLVFGKYLVRIKAGRKNSRAGEGSAYLIESFSLQDRKSRFTKNVNVDLTKHGDLLVKANYEIYEEGDYILEGTLYNLMGEPVAWAEKPITLATGTKWIPLEFHGYIFYKNQYSGPFVLRHLSLNYVKKNLSIINAGLSFPYYKTPKWHWKQFNKNPYDNVIMKEKIRKLQLWLSDF